MIKVPWVLPRSPVQSKGFKYTFEVGPGSRETYRLKSIVRIQNAGVQGSGETARLTAAQHLEVDFLVGGLESGTSREEVYQSKRCCVEDLLYGARIEREFTSLRIVSIRDDVVLISYFSRGLEIRVAL